MPKSRKRPVAAAKARAARRSQHAWSQLPPLLVPPWEFVLMDDKPPDVTGEEWEAFAASYPFRVWNRPGWGSLSMLADEHGQTPMEMAEVLAWLAGRGFVEWDVDSQTLYLAMPGDDLTEALADERPSSPGGAAEIEVG